MPAGAHCTTHSVHGMACVIAIQRTNRRRQPPQTIPARQAQTQHRANATQRSRFVRDCSCGRSRRPSRSIRSSLLSRPCGSPRAPSASRALACPRVPSRADEPLRLVCNDHRQTPLNRCLGRLARRSVLRCRKTARCDSTNRSCGVRRMYIGRYAGTGEHSCRIVADRVVPAVATAKVSNGR